MLFTKESDYAIRIVRALRSGEKIRAKDICECEEIPEAFAYKILKKLEKAQIVRVTRGTHGGCMLIKNPEELYAKDCLFKGREEDKCQLYVFRLAVYFAENAQHDPEKLKWWYWKDKKYPETK